MERNEINDDDLDDILDSALDDFNANPPPPQPASPSPSPPSSSDPSQNPSPLSGDDLNILSELQNPEFQKGFEDFMKQLDPNFSMGPEFSSLSSNPEFLNEVAQMQKLFEGMGMPSQQQTPSPAPSSSSPTPTRATSSPSPSSSSSSPSPTPSGQGSKKESLRSNIADTLNKLKTSDQEAESEAGEGKDPLSSLLSMMGTEGSEGSMEALMEGMMGQLLSKDVLYEPMKELSTLYPEYLQEVKGKVPEAEYAKYQAQYEVTKKIVEAYDNQSGGGNFVQILELMQQMQEYGQPPTGLLEKMAPGMEIGEDGLPKIPGMSPNQCPVQ